MSPRRAVGVAAVLLATLGLPACDQEPEAPDPAAEPADDPFAGLPPPELPDGLDSLARADGWEVTEGGVLARAGDTFELVAPAVDVPASPDDGPTEIVYHLDRVEADGTLVETVEIVAITVTAEGPPTEEVTLPDDSDVHYDLFAEVTRADGTFAVYRDWLYAR